MQSEGQVASLPFAASSVAGAGSTGSASGSKSQVVPPSPTTSGVVEDGSTDTASGGQVAHHSPPTSGVEGGGSTGSESFRALDPLDVMIDGFGSFVPVPRAILKPMMANPRGQLLVDRRARGEPPSPYADRRTFFDLSKRTYDGMLIS